MKTCEAIKKSGGKASGLARLLGVTPGAVSQWGEDLPSARVWQLRAIRPEWFVDQTLAVRRTRARGVTGAEQVAK